VNDRSTEFLYIDGHRVGQGQASIVLRIVGLAPACLAYFRLYIIIVFAVSTVNVAVAKINH